MWLLSLLLGCGSDHFLSYGKVEREIEYVYVQDNFIEGSDDTGSNEPIWVDSFEQPSVSNGVDIIWVIDGSGSMNNDYQMILQGISDMLNNLPSLNWRLVIISMTPYEAAAVTSFPLLPGDDQIDATLMFSDNVQGGNEHGFDSVYEFLMNNVFAQQWLREDAALLTVFVSDENDQSTARFPDPVIFANWLSSMRNEVYVSSIVNVLPENSECTPNPIDVGLRYIELTNIFNGHVVDICSTNWSQGVADASSQITPREWLDLSKTPANEQEIYVFIDGIEFYDWYYSASENRVYFNTIPDERSLVEIAYYY